MRTTGRGCPFAASTQVEIQSDIPSDPLGRPLGHPLGIDIHIHLELGSNDGSKMRSPRNRFESAFEIGSMN